ncbi:DUF1858 domain-containing protein [Facklamia miroungae]|uniref:DUF1858 domain-containing protein n=1 Tax=Facklamia miroungae TaxID=120956 RepID=A0A1G7QLK1_9LACT|nr:DUF1858 domain-containing protein [Facklamia miroungae]NKZ28985.1 DUF1858 domain-containing protein [Facklamia miroungae]SDF99386.1 protein of unknown function [Facklamia miroungae]
MNNQVNISQPVSQAVEGRPDLLNLLVEIGFTPLANPKMLATVGRLTSIKKGAKLINVPIDSIIQKLQWNGYEVIDTEEE